MKKILSFLLFFFMCFSVASAELPTQEQLDKYCIKVIHTIDGDAHYFSVALIESFDEAGFVIKWGKKLEKRNFIKREDILNWQEVVTQYRKVKGI